MLDVTFNLMSHQNRSVDLTGTIARRANFAGDDVHLRAYSLAGNLHQTEFRKWQYGVFGTIVLHLFLHLLRDELLVVEISHIDKIDNNYSAHITQPQLACDFAHSLKVYGECCSFLILLAVAFISTVDIDHVKC